MKTRFAKMWEEQPPKQRTLIVVLALLLAAILYGALVQAAWQARLQLRGSVATLRAQATLVDRQAAELARLRATPPTASTPTDLATLLQGSLDAAGLAAALPRLAAVDADRVSVVFGALSFADWLAWVVRLQAQQVRLESCRIEALTAPGQVSVSATFVRVRR